jgi:ATP-dependent protease ClpP protease subunit
MASPLIVDGALVLHGMVGDDWLSDDTFDGRDVIDALAELGRGKDITVRLNSGGGDAFEGVAIYNALIAHGGKVTVLVEGIAASAASIIAQAGNPTVMCPGSTMMVHEPMGMAAGAEDDMNQMAGALGAIANAMAEVYALKTGRPVTEIRGEMKAETWMTADEAIVRKYADARDESRGKVTAAAFNYHAYAQTPESFLVLADQRGWNGIKQRFERSRPKTSRPNDTHALEAGWPGTPKEEQVNEKSKEDGGELEARLKAQKDETDKAQAQAVQQAQATAAGIIAAATDAGVPKLSAALIQQGMSLEQAKVKIDGAVAIKAKVAQAHKMNSTIDLGLADAYIEAGASIDHVGRDLLDRLAKVSAVTAGRSTHSVAGGGRVPQPTTGPAPEDLNASGIYARRAKVRASRTPALVAYE